MDITIHAGFLPPGDPEATAFNRDTPGSIARNDVGYQGLRRITAGPASNLLPIQELR